ncbi:uncharacterized protein EI97DRAFT_176316 [Westerdykella ornata]|uniref:Uncharacterized protein n=1 Tax=Westerdykella ornata TaxID=318751 RepID=A0A6A6JT52_WESOR|nr:uncharacterized protein EI97DRAFT_176316 [Westerdykella ornata]KAF2279445.1 hypothetical protein EI97DRAFT_176316 [Westerdykella ornata]
MFIMPNMRLGRRRDFPRLDIYDPIAFLRPYLHRWKQYLNAWIVRDLGPELVDTLKPQILEMLKQGQIVDELVLVMIPLLKPEITTELDQSSLDALKNELKPFIESPIVSFAKGKARAPVPKIEGEPTDDTWAEAFDLGRILGDSLLSALPEDVTPIAESRMATLEALLRDVVESLKERVQMAEWKTDQIPVLKLQIEEILANIGQGSLHQQRSLSQPHFYQHRVLQDPSWVQPGRMLSSLRADLAKVMLPSWNQGLSHRPLPALAFNQPPSSLLTSSLTTAS